MLTTAATNTIHFTIPTSDPKFSGGVYTIQPAAPLPTITQAVDIDGSSEPGSPVLQSLFSMAAAPEAVA